MRNPYTRHIEVPFLEAWRAKIEAENFNCARRAFARWEPDQPVWLDLPGLRSLNLVMMPDAWVVADRALNDLPVIAWMDFRPCPDRAVHEHVTCEMRLFHNQARLILDTVKATMCNQLRAQLGDGEGDGGVVALPLSPQ